MKGNVSAGILLMMGAAILLSIGFSGKGKQVLDIIFNRSTTGAGTSKYDDPNYNPMDDPDAEIKSDSSGDPDWKFPGQHSALFVPESFSGMKGAAKA